MKNKKKIRIGIIAWFLLSVFIAVFYRYIKVTQDGNYSWSDSFPVWIGGVIIGGISFLAFLFVDYFLIRKLKSNKSIKILLKSIILISIVLIISSDLIYKW